MELSDAQNISGVRGYNQQYLKIDDLSNEALVKSEITQIDERMVAISGNSVSASIENVVNIYNRFYLIGISMMILVAFLVLFKVNATGLLERKKEIAIMQSVGWTKKEVTKQITSEVFLQTLLGFILGVIASIIVIIFFSSISIQTPSIGLENSATVTLPLVLSPIIIIDYLIAIIVVSFLVSYLLAKKISTDKPSENLRSL
jgi:putative ABC transport system permease protein